MTKRYQIYQAKADRAHDRIIARLDGFGNIPIFPDRPSPRACEFQTGPVTMEMARWADAVSQVHYRKRAERVQLILARRA